MMQTYLVGGAVRDKLLGAPVAEQDWVVVGATVEEMLDAGFRQVGRDFPVFLHPHTNEEYALARTERKSGHGYTGFVVHADPSVSLDEDLRRRDLTVNAMAMDRDGTLIDPYGGRRDLENRTLRHVSDAFIEDPLRVLRVARFAARYAHLGFSIASETLALMREIVAAGELAHLPAERIWVETERALRTLDPQVFIDTLRTCAALAELMPEVEALFGVPQRVEYHPEIDTGKHLLMVLRQAALLTRESGATGDPAQGRSPLESGDSCVVFAALTHDLGKALTPAAVLPSHRGHEAAGLPLVDALCQRLKVPTAYRQLALDVCEHHLNCHRVRELRGATLLGMLERIGALREGTRFERFLLACEADARGRTGYEDSDYPQALYLREARARVMSVTAAGVQAAHQAADTPAEAASTPEDAAKPLRGKALGDAMRAERIRRLNALRRPLGQEHPV